MSSKCYLVARDAQTNNFEMMKDFSSLREADLFTINYHSSEDLAKSILKINDKVDHLTDHVEHIDGRLEIIGKGTKMELFDTLHN